MDIEEAENRLFQLKQSMELLDLVTGKTIEEDTKLNIKAIETVLSELEKKEAIINEMANIISAIMTGITAIQNQFEEEYCEFIKSDEDCCWKTEKKCTDCIKDYFTKKCEGK